MALKTDVKRPMLAKGHINSKMLNANANKTTASYTEAVLRASRKNFDRSFTLCYKKVLILRSPVGQPFLNACCP